MQLEASGVSARVAIHQKETIMKLSHFELRLTQRVVKSLRDRTQSDLDLLHYFPEIWIDGEHLDEPHPVCVSAVLGSMERPQAMELNREWRDVFTCGCGTASCAGIDEGVGAVHSDTDVEWVLRRPQANRFGQDPVGYRAWCEAAKWHHYRFNRHQVTKELIRFLDEVWLLINKGLIVDDLKFEALSWFDRHPRHELRQRGASRWDKFGFNPTDPIEPI